MEVATQFQRCSSSPRPHCFPQKQLLTTLVNSDTSDPDRVPTGWVSRLNIILSIIRWWWNPRRVNGSSSSLREFYSLSIALVRTLGQLCRKAGKQNRTFSLEQCTWAADPEGWLSCCLPQIHAVVHFVFLLQIESKQNYVPLYFCTLQL